jgi:hypothetical protein
MLSVSDFVSLVGAQHIAPSSPLRGLCVISVPRVPRASQGPSRGIKPCRIRRSTTSLPQLSYNPHLQKLFGSAGNNRLTVTESTRFTLLESTFTRAPRKCGKQTTYKSIGIRTCENCASNLFTIRTYKNGGRGVMAKQEHDSLSRLARMRHNPPAQAQHPHPIPAMGRIQ